MNSNTQKAIIDDGMNPELVRAGLESMLETLEPAAFIPAPMVAVI